MAKQTDKFRDHDAPDPRYQAILAKYFEDAAARMQRTLIAPPGKSPAAQEWNQARAAAIGAQIRKIQQELKQKASGWTGKALSAAMKQGTKTAEKQAVFAGVRRIPQLRGGFHLLDKGTVEQFARDTYSDLAKAADGMAAHAQATLRRMAATGVSNAEVNSILAGGVIEGKPVDAIRELREALRKVHGKTVTIPTAKGDMSFSAGYYAQMVAVTKTRQAVCQARHARLQDLGLDLVTIVGRVSEYFCTAYLDRVFSISGKHPKYPPLSSLPGGGPPFHPNCSKSTAPFVEDFATDAELEAADPPKNDPMTSTRNTTDLQRLFQMTQGRQAVEAIHKKVVESITRQGGPLKPWDIATQIPKGKTGLEVSRGLNAIGAVHDLPAAAPLTIEARTLGTASGRYTFGLGLMEIDPAHSRQPFTVAHEFGHYLDNKILGGGGRRDSGILEATTLRMLEPILQTNAMRHIAYTHAATTDPQLRAYCEYLMDPMETWARAYSQWVATQSGNASMRAAVEESYTNGPTQWQPDEFDRSVRPLVERILKSKGVLP